MRNVLLSLLAVGLVACATACSTEPKSQDQREALRDNAKASLKSMEARDAGLANVVNNAYAYIVFPDVGKGGFVIGGAFGRGIVYANGQMVGYAAIDQASVGALAGGQSYEELIVFKDQTAFQKFQDNRLSFGADVSAVALKAGAAASAQFRNGVEVFIHNQGGLMADASLNGQNISFHATRDVDTNNND
ncbi:MAG TPA: lipid-binding SYLF domain-containing protein [Tepidisphaeraceae bacterium]|nr:lipid-binding SYLF domain-containing protein [Tepidisphaeraceae bacterium]